jgi:hypothetical protein
MSARENIADINLDVQALRRGNELCLFFGGAGEVTKPSGFGF